MSVAFTKEQDYEAQAADLPDRPVSAAPNLVTAQGLARIEAELAAAQDAYRAALAAGDVEADRTAMARAPRDRRYGSDRRAPHFHVAESTRGVRRLTTQLYIQGEPLNETDAWLHMVRDPAQRARRISPMQDGAAIERNAHRIQYDIVMIA